MRRLAVLGLLGVLLLAVSRDATAEEGAAVRWTAGAEAEGRRIADAWPGVVAEVMERLELRPSLAGAEVVVVSGHDELVAQARVAVPPWAAAVTVGVQRIVLRADVPTTALSTTVQTLRHEAVHLVWARHAGLRRQRLPRWFEEGLAEHLGGGVALASGARLDTAAALGRLHAFTDLERAFPADADAAGLAYLQSRSWMAFVVSRTDERALARVLRGVLEGPPDETPGAALSRALHAATAHDLSDWTAEWLRSLDEARTRWWLWFFTDLGGVLLVVLALVGVACFAWVRRRRREQIESLPDEPLVREAPNDE